MSETVICTGMWGPAAESYGPGFVESLGRLWGSARVLVFTDRPLPHRLAIPPNVELRGMAETDGWTEFMARWKGNARAEGREVMDRWKRSAVARGYYFKFDAVKFAGQGFVPEAAARDLPDGALLVWLDADVIAHRPVPANLVEELLNGSPGAYLGRPPKHSEIGFWAVRLDDATRSLIRRFAATYRTDAVFDLSEWHSAYVWDCARAWTEERFGITLRNITPGGHGHVWFQSRLGLYLDHLKGKRKAQGRSPERRR